MQQLSPAAGAPRCVAPPSPHPPSLICPLPPVINSSLTCPSAHTHTHHPPHPQFPHRGVRELGWLPEMHGVYISRWHHGSPAHRYGLYALHWIAGEMCTAGVSLHRCRRGGAFGAALLEASGQSCGMQRSFPERFRAPSSLRLPNACPPSLPAEVNGQPTPDLDTFIDLVRRLPDGADVSVRLVHFESNKSKASSAGGGEGHRQPVASAAAGAAARVVAGHAAVAAHAGPTSHEGRTTIPTHPPVVLLSLPLFTRRCSP